MAVEVLLLLLLLLLLLEEGLHPLGNALPLAAAAAAAAARLHLAARRFSRPLPYARPHRCLCEAFQHWQQQHQVPQQQHLEQRPDAAGLAVAGLVAAGLVAAGLVAAGDRKSTRLNSSHAGLSRMPSSA